MEELQYIRNKKEIFLIDLSWVLYKSWYSYRNLDVDGRPTGHIYGPLRVIMNIKNWNRDAAVILCKDGKPIEREKENKNYKANREYKMDYNIWEDLDIIRDMAFRIHDVYMAYNEKLEADDLIYSLAKTLERETDNSFIYIVSSDNDLLQALSDKVKIVKKITKRGGLQDIVEKDTLYEQKSMVRNFRSCPTEKLPYYRAIIGDRSDNLKGIKYFPRELATMIAKRCNNIDDIKKIKFEDLPEERVKPSYEKYIKKCKDNFDMIKSNYKIMNLKEDVNFKLWRDDREEIKQKADRLADELNMSQYKDFLIKIGYQNDIGI